MTELEKLYRGAIIEQRKKDWTPAYILLGIAGLVTAAIVALAIMVTVIVVAVAATVVVVTLKKGIEK
jgi:hypothetical protein